MVSPPLKPGETILVVDDDPAAQQKQWHVAAKAAGGHGVDGRQ